MENEVKYMTFYENWVELMEECTPEEWYELCKIITNLRFKGIDTDTKTIKNLKIRMAWTLIRPSIKKSNRNTRYNNKSKAEKTTNLTASNTPNDITNQTTEDNGSESLKLINNGNREIPAEFAIEEPVKTDVRLDNILTIPLNKPSLFNDYLTKLIHLHKKDTIGSITTYEEIEKEEVLDGMRNILLSSGYAADSVDNTIEECVTSTIAA